MRLLMLIVLAAIITAGTAGCGEDCERPGAGEFQDEGRRYAWANLDQLDTILIAQTVTVAPILSHWIDDWTMEVWFEADMILVDSTAATEHGSVAVAYDCKDGYSMSNLKIEWPPSDSSTAR